MKMKAMSMKMKAKKASVMKMRMKKAKKVSKVGSKRQVFSGSKVRSKGGLQKGDLVKSKTGKVVSKKQSAHGKKIYAKYLAKWNGAVQKARKQQGVKGFCPIGGKTAKGQALLRAARSIYKK